MRIAEIVEALGCLEGKRVRMACLFGEVVQDVERVRYLRPEERMNRWATIILDSGRAADRDGRPKGVCFDSRNVAGLEVDEAGAVVVTGDGRRVRLEIVPSPRLPRTAGCPSP